MLIDWFTVAAQVINFLILVWLLKRFLYRPILDAIDAREKGVAAELADADAKRTEARKERDEFQHKNAAFEQQRATLLSQTTEEAKAERQRLLDEARQAADEQAAAEANATPVRVYETPKALGDQLWSILMPKEKTARFAGTGGDLSLLRVSTGAGAEGNALLISDEFRKAADGALDGTDHRSHDEQNSMIRRYIAWRNRNAQDKALREITTRANVA